MAGRQANRPLAVLSAVRMKHNTLAGWLRAVVAACLLAGAAGQSGCVVAAVGAAAAGTVAYVRGKLEASLANDYREVVKATDRAVERLQFRKISENGDALKTVFVARTGDDTRIHITVTKKSDNLVQVEIRVGTFGNEALSRTLLDSIKATL